MRALSYLLITTIKNWFKNLLKTPGLLIVYVLCIAMFGFMLIPGSAFPPASLERLPYLRAGIYLLFGFILYTGISKGLKSGATFFKMADVNMLFTSPVRPQSILLYGIVGQMGTSLLATLFLLFQVANMRNLLFLDTKGIMALILGWFLTLVITQIVSLSVYSLTAPHPKRRKAGKYILYGLMGLLIGGLLIYVILKGGKPESVLDYFALPFMDYFPLIGWIDGFVTGMIVGDYLKMFICLLLFVLIPALGIVLVRRSDSDYYEDVLQTTEQTFMLKAAMKDGKPTARNVMMNVKAGKSGIAGKGTGASTFFYRHLTEQRRTGLMVMDKSSIVIIVLSLIAGFVLRNLTDNEEISVLAACIGSFVGLSYMLFFLTMSGKFTQELSKPFIYLVPASNVAKLFFSNLSTVVKSLVEGLIAFGAITLLAGLPVWFAPAAAAAYATLSQLYISMSILTQRILGSNNSKLLNTMIYFLSGGIILGPGILVYVILQVVLNNVNPDLAVISYLAAILYNLSASLLVMYLGRGILEEGNT